jgi:hypothetical protein
MFNSNNFIIVLAIVIIIILITNNNISKKEPYSVIQNEIKSQEDCDKIWPGSTFDNYIDILTDWPNKKVVPTCYKGGCIGNGQCVNLTFSKHLNNPKKCV